MELNNQLTVNAGWLVDGSARPVQSGIQLKIIDGRIDTIRENWPDHPGQPSDHPDATTLDLKQDTVLPALVDSHVHLSMSGTMDPEKRLGQLDMEFGSVVNTIQRHLDQHLAAGVLAVRDGGDRWGFVMRHIHNCVTSRDSVVRVKSPGRAWHKPGRYGRLIGRAPDPSTSLAQAIELAPDPIDHVKIVNSGLNSLKVFGRQTLPQFDRSELETAVLAAERRGIKIMVHANGHKPVQTAAAAGCHSIEHGFFMGSGNLRLLADKAVFWVPTAVTMHAYCRYLEQLGKETDIARKNLDHQIEQLHRARQLNVPIALGTDAGSPAVDHGHAVVDEMKILIQAGYTIEEVIRFASFNGAQLLGIKDLGLLAPGMPATFIVVEGDPSGLPDSLRRPKAVYLKGERVSGYKLRGAR